MTKDILPRPESGITQVETVLAASMPVILIMPIWKNRSEKVV